MIICILETYRDDGPVVWFANMDEARPEFIKGLEWAEANEDSLPYGDFGFQHDQDNALSVDPPVHVDKHVWVDFD